MHDLVISRHRPRPEVLSGLRPRGRHLGPVVSGRRARLVETGLPHPHVALPAGVAQSHDTPPRQSAHASIQSSQSIRFQPQAAASLAHAAWSTHVHPFASLTPTPCGVRPPGAPAARATFFAFHGDKPRAFSCFWPLGPSVGCGTVPAGTTPAVGACVRGVVDDVRVVPTPREGFLT